MVETVSLADYPDLGEKTYRVLKEEILNGRLAPGSRLVIVELAERMGVSRTPVADALNRLMAERFVVGSPRKGYSVSSLDARDIVDLMDASKILQQGAVESGIGWASEADIARMRSLLREMKRLVDDEGRYVDFLAFMCLDRALHVAIVSSARNTLLIRLYDQLNSHSHLIRARLAGELTGYRPFRVLREHEAIVEAFASGDAAAAKKSIADHLDATKAALVEAWLKVEGRAEPQ